MSKICEEFSGELSGRGCRVNERPRSRPLDNVQLSQKRAHAKSGQLANGDSVARVAKRLCPRCLRSTLQERKLAKSSGPSLPAPYQGVDGDAGRTRGSNRSKELFSISSISTIRTSGNIEFSDSLDFCPLCQAATFPKCLLHRSFVALRSQWDGTSPD